MYIPDKEKTDMKWLKKWQKGHAEDQQTMIGRYMTLEKKKMLNQILDHIQVSSVLEAGCGLGHTAEVFGGRNFSYLAIDISKEAVSVCRDKGINAKQMNLKDVHETFDLVFSDGMLEHFLNFPFYARHMARISQKYILLIQPNYNSLTGQTLAYIANLVRSHINIYEYNYRLEDFISVFEDIGFSIEMNLPAALDILRVLLFRSTSKG